MIARSRTETGSRMEPNSSLVRPELTDEQWSLIADLFVSPTARSARRSSESRRPELRGRDPVGAAERRSLEGSAALVPFVRDLLAAL